MTGQQLLELLAAVLAAAIGVVQQRIGLASSPDRHHQGIGDELRRRCAKMRLAATMLWDGSYAATAAGCVKSPKPICSKSLTDHDGNRGAIRSLMRGSALRRHYA